MLQQQWHGTSELSADIVARHNLGDVGLLMYEDGLSEEAPYVEL